ncbi:MAG: 16S rRNA (cytosine(1402)-N(4))-methyltransferase RsmH [Candidatus Saccharibacteria bacterium]
MHLPVLYEETLNYLITDPAGIYVDCTAGGGGHLQGILERTNYQAQVIGIDQDQEILQETARKFKGKDEKVRFIHNNFRRLEVILQDLNIAEVSGVLIDLGVSSFQLDEGQRGFSYHQDSQLDMRMDLTQELSAWHIVNQWPRDELEKLLWEYGEERFARRIVEGIIRTRAKKDLNTTADLVEVIKQSVPGGGYQKGKHPARRTFQALRIAVNDELGAVKEVLPQAVKALKTGGRLCVITFHSLEDRLVKEYFTIQASNCLCPPQLPVCTCRHRPCLQVLTRKPVTATEQELADNRRARSAKLRVAQKIEVLKEIGEE